MLGLFSRWKKAAETPAPPVQSGPSQADKDAAEALVKQGNQFLGKDDIAQAILCYREAIHRDPGNAGAHVALGYGLMETQKFDEAQPILLQAARLDPRNLDARYMLGGIAKMRNDHPGVVREMGAVLDIDETFEPVYPDLCVSLFRLGRLDEVLKLTARGIVLFPQRSDMHFYRGNVFVERNQQDEALVCYTAADLVEPNHPDILAGLAHCEQHRGNNALAVGYLERTLALRPEDAAKFSMMLLSSQYHGAQDREALFRKHLEYAERYEAPLEQEVASAPPHPPYDERRPLRIGYVSGDFRNHSLACFVEPVIQFHDRSRVEVFCYYTYPLKDTVTARLQSYADHWRDCSEVGDADLARQIRNDGIDVLVDLSGHTAQNRLRTFARRPAPVQVSWLGYQATTGLRSIGYRLTDASMDPPGETERFHSEQLIRLSSAACFQPAPESPPVNALPCLSCDSFMFGALHYPAKITPAAVQAWAEILHRVPQSRLMLGYAKPELVADFTARFADCGIGVSRLVFQPGKSLGEYLKLFHEIDLVLDTFPYNGGTTTLHSAWMGVPVVTIEGQASIARAGAAIMRGFGCGDFVVQDVVGYVNLAVAIAEHPQRLAEVRAGLRSAMQVTITDQSRTLVRELEDTYLRLRRIIPA